MSEGCPMGLFWFFQGLAGFLSLSRELSREKKREALQAVKQAVCECDANECEKWLDAV